MITIIIVAESMVVTTIMSKRILLAQESIAESKILVVLGSDKRWNSGHPGLSDPDLYVALWASTSDFLPGPWNVDD